MPKKKVLKQSLEKLKDEEVVLEIIEDSSDEEGLPPPPPDTAIRVSKGNEILTQTSVQDIKDEIAKPARKKRVMSEEQKRRMREGREKKKAEKKALEAGKKVSPAPVELKAEPTPPPAPVVNTDEPPRWFQAYLASQKKSEHEIVKETEAPVKKSRGRPVGKKDSKPRTKKNVVVPETVATPKPSIRFI